MYRIADRYTQCTVLQTDIQNILYLHTDIHNLLYLQNGIHNVIDLQNDMHNVLYQQSNIKIYYTCRPIYTI